MSSTHADAVAELISPDAATFASLPLSLSHLIFLALPADARGRASCVCRAWRDALAQPSLWTRLDMSIVRVKRQRFATVLHGAAGRARGELRQLELSQQEVVWDVLLRLLTANAGSLCELHLHTPQATKMLYAASPLVMAVSAAAPLLHVLLAEHVWCKWEDAPRILRAEPPFAALQVRHTLVVHFSASQVDIVGGMERFGPFATALADTALQPALLNVSVWHLDTAQPAVLGALVDAALARRLRELTLQSCTPPAAAPLARLLAGGSLAVFEICRTRAAGTPLFDVDGAALVADALCVNTALTKLKLHQANLCDDLRVAELLLGALVGHPSLRELWTNGEGTPADNLSAFGALLGALVAADAPALQILVCSCNALGDAGMAPIVEALALNCHLRKLDLRDNGMSEEFARERLLPAVLANTSLRELLCAGQDKWPAAVEAEELVRLRA
jgi:hypothetical protein